MMPPPAMTTRASVVIVVVPLLMSGIGPESGQPVERPPAGSGTRAPAEVTHPASRMS